ncbi:Rv0340 family IniB-related protein [Mycolicibacterium sp.]|uniref:Rv0340 family IniB-related protein n=1 Tax=Mycolicibacterium sp. TaxID=2320850 RepID=UPI003D0D963A
MPNPLMEFVLSLVRDPGAAARYAQNPEQAIADAQLAGVTTADVNSLIPVVSDSASLAVVDDNVWTSGEAVSAFDAFGDELPVQVDDEAPVVPDLITDLVEAGTDGAGPDSDLDAALPAGVGALDEPLDVITEHGADDDWAGWDGIPDAGLASDPGALDAAGADAPDFDVFGG